MLKGTRRGRLLLVRRSPAARDAHRVARWLGARLLQREVELLAQRARLDLLGLQPEDVPIEAGGALGLTARESEVLQLVARGYTNPEIAGELTISVKTASVHVSNIMRKLNVSSRLGAGAVAHRLAPPDVRGAEARPRKADRRGR